MGTNGDKIRILKEEVEVFRSRIEELEKEYKEKLAEGYMSSYE